MSSSFLRAALPLIQSPMAGVQGHALAAAVAIAGAVGSLPCGMLDEQGVRREVASLRERLSAAGAANAPFALNFFCHEMPPTRDLEQDARWSLALQQFYPKDQNRSPEVAGTSSSRRPVSQAMLQVVCDLRPPIVSFHYGLPSDLSLVRRLRAQGSVVLSTATTVAEAVFLAKSGVADAVIAQGLEAGGHRGVFLGRDGTKQVAFRIPELEGSQQQTLDLTRAVAAALSPLGVPVVAAGGITCAADVQACMSAGAVAVQCGTAFLCTVEAQTSALHKAAAADPTRETSVTSLFTGRPARAVITRLTQTLDQRQLEKSDCIPCFPYAADALLPLRQRAEAEMDDAFTPMLCGSNRKHLLRPDGGQWSAAEVVKRLFPGS
jgi:nitronate monooxygenase